MSDSQYFYQQLAGYEDFDLFFSDEYATPVPDDWLVVVADIEQSTLAVEKGFYREVNAVGVATIVAVMKAVEDIPIPYVFGGDGASFCIPPAVSGKVRQALSIVQQIADREFNLILRAGLISASEIRARGADILVGKYQPVSQYEQAIFKGNGLSLADSLIKNQGISSDWVSHESPVMDISSLELLSGFECRWGEIAGKNDEVINILVQVISSNEQVYKEIVDKIRSIYGCQEKCSPINEEGMHLTLNAEKLGVEARIRTGLLPWYKKTVYILKLRLIVLLGRYLMRQGKVTGETDWGSYKERLLENTDVQRFDDMLRMMVSGNEAQRSELISFLDSLKDKNQLVYGLHVTTHSLVTCMITDYNWQHVHFIDGKGGGYTLAAVQLKQQLRDLDNNV